MNRVLIVQCCHPAQLFYVAGRLRERHPDWALDVLLLDRPQLHHYIQVFRCFNQVYWFRNRLPKTFPGYEYILFPLLNRGYRQIKSAARRLPGPAFEVDYEGNLRPLASGRLIRSLLQPLASPSGQFAQYLKEFPHPPLGKRILLVESCHPSLLRLVEKHFRPLISPQADVYRVGEGSGWKAWKEAPAQGYDSAVVFLSGEHGFAVLKILPFLLRIPKILVFNENGHYFYASARSMIRFLYERVLRGSSLPRSCPRILFLQTEVPSYVSKAVPKLKETALFPRSEILLVCREEDRSLFHDLPEVAGILTYSRRSWKRNLQLFKQLKRFEPDLISAVFSGRPIFRKHKLFFFLFPVRRHVAFNAHLDCYPITPLTLFRIFRKEPLLLEESEMAEPSHEVLLIQTEGDLETKRAIEALQDPRVVTGARISIFCREDKRAFFQSIHGVERIFSYQPGKPLPNLKTLCRLFRLRPDVLAAIQSGRPVFRKQKLLFSLLPARKRLVFNRSLICFDPEKSGQQRSEDLWSLIQSRPKGEEGRRSEEFSGRASRTCPRPGLSYGFWGGFFFSFRDFSTF